VWELATLSFLNLLALGALITRRAIVGCQFPDAALNRKDDCDHILAPQRSLIPVLPPVVCWVKLLCLVLRLSADNRSPDTDRMCLRSPLPFL
jgi:hypothetical protein